MTYSIVYSTLTGNTLKLANVVKESLKEVLYFGTVSEKALKADVIFVGFWTDQGHANDEITNFLKTIKDKKIVLFGTAGFELPGYFDEILKNVKSNIDSSNEILDTFMCRGKIRESVKAKYEAMLNNEATKDRGQFLLDNFNKSLSHPNEEDFSKLRELISKY